MNRRLLVKLIGGYVFAAPLLLFSKNKKKKEPAMESDNASLPEYTKTATTSVVNLSEGSKYKLADQSRYLDTIIFRLEGADYASNPAIISPPKNHKINGSIEPLEVDCNQDFGLRFLGNKGWVVFKLQG